ncbi:MAG TPA: glycoside hydrolase family 97 catalytic domain-containing protein [Blastocatellia bacterium]|nr:glycoside hydrolase family 97 catalytic domain-containing protein [Blastocatellia bacterium]
MKGPSGQVRFLLRHQGNRLVYSMTFRNALVVESSNIGIVVDGVDLGRDASIKQSIVVPERSKYLTRGIHSEAINHYNGSSVRITNVGRGPDSQLEVRVFDDGVAFRFVVRAAASGVAKSRVADESTAFTLPAGSFVWYHDFEGHYEGVHAGKDISAVKPGDWAALPLTFRLPNGAGYAAITEASLVDYAGMGLEAVGERTFTARLGHALPVSYPYRLRYGADEAERLSEPARIDGAIVTPWRVVMVGPDLNALVNCDIVGNVSSPPDSQLFPQGVRTEWLKPGRCVWRFLDGGDSTVDGMKEFSRLAGQLGFEYNLIEGFWQRWTDEQLKELVTYSGERGVRIWLWKHSRDIRSADARRKFFKQCHDAGIAGVKLDFFDHEAKEVIGLYQAALREAAQFKLMVDFHGANKPSGESRTWPNEMTREGIYGLEHRTMQAWSRHNTTLPFTRMLAGHADYTVMHFGERRRETSWAHQIASAAIFTSPLLVYAANPKSILDNPAAELIKSIPSVWDETIVLSVSEIGKVAVFARRNGARWFLAIMNGPDEQTLRLPLTFLGPAKYDALLVRDDRENPAAVVIDKATVGRLTELSVDLRSGGGFVGRFERDWASGVRRRLVWM